MALREAGVKAKSARIKHRLPEPVRVKVKWQFGRTLVVARRFLDTDYWRSLYRRLASQSAE